MSNNNATNQHQHETLIASLKEKLRQLASRRDDAGRFARAQFKALIKRAEDRLASYTEADAAYGKGYGELTAAQSAFDEKRAELLAAVERELAPLAQRLNAATASCGYPPKLDPFPWSYSGTSTAELASKARTDPNGHQSLSLGEVIRIQRMMSAVDRALAIYEEGKYAPGPFSTAAERAVQEAFEVRWKAWAELNRDKITALTAQS